MGRRKRRGTGWLGAESEEAKADAVPGATDQSPVGAELMGDDPADAGPAGAEPIGEAPTGAGPVGTEPADAGPTGEVPIDTANPESTEALRRAAEAVWVASQKGAPWATLAFVPAEPGLRTDALARALAEIGSVQRDEPVEFLDLQDATFANSRSLAETLALSAAFRYVVSLGCPTDDQAANLLAASAAAAVLVVAQDSTRVAAARRVVEIVGPERFLGAVVLEPTS